MPPPGGPGVPAAARRPAAYWRTVSSSRYRVWPSAVSATTSDLLGQLVHQVKRGRLVPAAAHLRRRARLKSPANTDSSPKTSPLGRRSRS